MQKRRRPFYGTGRWDPFTGTTVLWVGGGFPETLGGSVGEGTWALDDASDVAFDVVGEGANGDVGFVEDGIFELLEGAVGVFSVDGDLGEDVGFAT